MGNGTPVNKERFLSGRTATKLVLLLMAAVLATSFSETSFSAPTLRYKSIEIEGIHIAYREGGIGRPITILFLHGVPSSSRMYDGIMRKLAKDYHVVALDYPGFGNSDAPSPADYAYTFDHLADTVQKFTEAIHIDRFVLFMQDYGAPVGMRLAMAKPCSVPGMIFQNGNVYEDGLGAMWEKRKAYWANRPAYEDEIRKGHLSIEVTRMRHIGDDPDIDAYDPDLWVDEHAFLNRPGEAEIQTELIYDYRTNIQAYPVWQNWLKKHQLPTLVVWGKHDLAFTVPGALAFRRDLPKAQITLVDAGHFAMDTRLEEVSALTANFLASNRSKFGRAKGSSACMAGNADEARGN